MTVTLKMDCATVIKECIFMQNMVLKKVRRTSMKVDGQIILRMGLEYRHILDLEDTKDIGKMVKDTAKEFLSMTIKIFILDNGRMVRKMAKALIFLKKPE
jgi:hypothetical protein